MKRDYFATGLDIGSSKTIALYASSCADGSIEVMDQVSLQSKGVSRGLVVDIGEATDVVSKALMKLREKTRLRPSEIYVNISGQTVKGSKSVGMIPLASRGREVTKPDVDRCVGVASTIHLPFDREIIHRIVHRFSIDDQPWIRNPIGLYASRLSCEAYIITADVNQIQSIYKCVNNAGYDIKELVYTGLADGAGMLDGSQAVIIDLGDSLTETTIFSDGSVAEIDIVPAGSRDFGADFRSSPEFDSVMSRIAIKIQDFVRTGGKVDTVFLTGGMVFADGIVEAVEEKMPYPIKIGIAKDVRGNISSVDGMRLSGAIGLARYGCARHAARLAEGRSAAHRLSNKIVDIFNRYF